MNTYKVGIYLRLSSEDKLKRENCDNSESINNQRNMLIDYINKHDNFILADEYCDENLSGAGTYRPEFQRLINDCKNKKIDIVLCKSQSRFSRDMEIIEKYINNKFIEWNIRFISLSDNADTDNNGNKKSRQINALVNEWFLEDISNNIRSAFNSKIKRGEFISPFASYGYKVSKKNNNKLVIDKNVSNNIKLIYKLYLKGYGLSQIANYLNQNNIPSPSYYKYLNGIKLNIVSNKQRKDIKWNQNAVKTILTNELYIGNLIQGKRTTISYKNHKIIKKPKELWIKKENTHEKIIDDNTFYKVQEIIKLKSKPIKKTGVKHTFSGLVFCNKCNNKMKKKNSSVHEYLVCTNCKSSIRFDLLEKIILQNINKIINKYYDKELLKKEITNNRINITNYKKLSNINYLIVNEFIKKIKIDIINKIIIIEWNNVSQ